MVCTCMLKRRVHEAYTISVVAGDGSMGERMLGSLGSRSAGLYFATTT